MMLRWIAAVTIASAAVLSAQPNPNRIQTLTFVSTVDDSTQPYALYLPPHLNPGKKYPLVISLHGEDTNHIINLRQVLGQPVRGLDAGRLALMALRQVRDLDFIVASPLARGTMGYRGIAEQDVYDTLADIKRRFPVDDDRVYLTGISMGGGGALWLALTRPDIWAAVAPVCPNVIPGLEAWAPNSQNLPIRLYHGEQDPLVPVTSSRNWQRKLLDLGVPVEYIEYPQVRHNAWDYAYREGGALDWFEGLTRVHDPERVRFTTDSYQYSSAYWVRIDSLTPGTRATIDARRLNDDARRLNDDARRLNDDARRLNDTQVEVLTQNLDGFTLSPVQPLQEVTIDGVRLRLPPGTAPSFHKQGGRWVTGRAEVRGKHPGSEGPVAAAVSGRHLYVYGTGGSPSPAELARRRKEAETAAHWSTEREPLQLTLPVKADKEVTPEDLDRDNLVLFGTRETNYWIGRLADHFPLELGAGAADYGLLFIADTGTHYALVNSGLPWWTDFEDRDRAASAFEPQPFAELTTFGDYLVFKGSVKNVVAQGRFDRNWKVPAEAAAQIAATGAVTIR